MAIGQYVATVLDCPDPLALATFYSEITGWTVRQASPTWVQLGDAPGPLLAFQGVTDHEPPGWPDGGHPQQAHLDFLVGDLDEGEAQVLAIGAIKADQQPEPDEFRVFIDPAGHPFCLVALPENRPGHDAAIL